MIEPSGQIMPQPAEWSVHAAHHYAENKNLTAWVDAYLRVDEWVNLDFADGLQHQPRWWLGPVLFPLATLNRLCGPEEGMKYPAEPEKWEREVEAIAKSLTDPLMLPPLITQIIDGAVYVGDGNHRTEAAKRQGWQSLWGVIWFDSEADWQVNHTRWTTYAQHRNSETADYRSISPSPSTRLIPAPNIL